MTGSCSSDDVRPGSASGDTTIIFKFTIYTDDSSGQTRAPGVWEENAADVAERILNIDDMRILFFDQSGVLLKSLTPAYLDYSGNETDNDGYYSLSVAFTHDYFDKFDDDDVIPFTVMILANR